MIPLQIMDILIYSIFSESQSVVGSVWSGLPAGSDIRLVPKVLEKVFVQKEKFLVLMMNLKALCSVEKLNQSIINFQHRIFIIMKFELPINVLSNIIVN